MKYLFQEINHINKVLIFILSNINVLVTSLKNIATQDAEGDANSFLGNSTYFVCGQEVREKNFFSMTTAIYF